MANGLTFRVQTAAMWSIVLSVRMLVAEAIFSCRTPTHRVTGVGLAGTSFCER
jgi:hypothetical protein